MVLPPPGAWNHGWVRGSAVVCHPTMLLGFFPSLEASAVGGSGVEPGSGLKHGKPRKPGQPCWGRGGVVSCAAKRPRSRTSDARASTCKGDSPPNHVFPSKPPGQSLLIVHKIDDEWVLDNKLCSELSYARATVRGVGSCLATPSRVWSRVRQCCEMSQRGEPPTRVNTVGDEELRLLHLMSVPDFRTSLSTGAAPARAQLQSSDFSSIEKLSGRRRKPRLCKAAAKSDT